MDSNRSHAQRQTPSNSTFPAVQRWTAGFSRFNRLKKKENGNRHFFSDLGFRALRNPRTDLIGVIQTACSKRMVRNAVCWLVAVLLFSPLPGIGDVFKYVDGEGKIHFTDAPLEGKQYRLEWKRAAKKLVSSNKKLVASGRRRIASIASIASAPPKRLSARRARYSTLIETTARRFNLYPELLHAVVRTESAYNPSAVSPAGATGLMQLMPGTARRYGVKDIWDPAQNLRGGAEYLRDLLDMFEHDLRLALAGYNAGEHAVEKYGNRIPPYPETQHYVRKVLQFLWAERASAGS